MAWSQAPRELSTTGFGIEADIGQGSTVQMHPFPVLCPGKGSGTHCGWQIWQLQLDFLTRETGASGKNWARRTWAERKNPMTDQLPGNTVPWV